MLKKIVAALPFVKNHNIEIVDVGDGRCVARMPYQEAFSTPPQNFPAAMIGMLGDVAGISACISALELGKICATADFTVKMTGQADGEAIEAEGEALNIGKTLVIGESKVYSIKQDKRSLCAVVLVTGRVISPG